MNVLGLLTIFFININLSINSSQGLGRPLIQKGEGGYTYEHGGITRGDTAKKELSIVFTGGDYGDGGMYIADVLNKLQVPSSFFFTGDFYRNPEFTQIIIRLINEGHYLGAHSDRHLLYCDWNNRDSLLVTKQEFMADLNANYYEMAKFGIKPKDASLFMPPYEWYNDTISQWTQEADLQLVNFSYGTRSNADYTTPDMSFYLSSDEILSSIVDYESSSAIGLNGFIMLIHIGTAPKRTDKFYHSLERLIVWLRIKGYEMKRIDELIVTQ